MFKQLVTVLLYIGLEIALRGIVKLPIGIYGGTIHKPATFQPHHLQNHSSRMVYASTVYYCSIKYQLAQDL
jgi:hypothetical protein